MTSQLIEKIKELKTLMQEKGETEVLKMFAEFFAKHPTVESIRWTQYAPYFNDGDPCVFSVHELTVRVTGTPKDCGYDDGYLSDYQLEKYEIENKDVLKADLMELSNLAEGVLEEVFELVFGNDVQVTVNRDGSVEKDDYNHD